MPPDHLAAHKPAAALKVDASGADDLLADILGELDPCVKASAAKPSTNAFARTRVSSAAPAAVKTFKRGSTRGASAASSPRAAAAERSASGNAGLGSSANRPGMSGAPGTRKTAAQPTESFSFAQGAAADNDYEGLADDGVMQQQEPQQCDEEQQEFSFAPPGEIHCFKVLLEDSRAQQDCQVCLCHSMLHAWLCTQQKRRAGQVWLQRPSVANGCLTAVPHSSISYAGGEVDVADDPFDASGTAVTGPKPAAATPAATTAATATASTPGAKAATAAAVDGAAGHKRFADDSPAGPDVQASPATGWMEVYGDDDAADGSTTSAAAAKDEAAAAGDDCSIEGLAADSDGQVPFFFMDAYENPDRPGVWFV